MNIRSIPYRTFRKIRHDGVIDLIDTAKYKTITPLLSPISNKVFRSQGVLTRQQLLKHADYSYTTETEYLPFKREPGLPEHQPQLFYQPGRRFVSTIENAMIIGKRGLSFTNDRQIIADVISPPNILPRRAKLAINAAILNIGPSKFYQYMNKHSSPDQTINEAACLLPPFKNYYHWTVECLMKIRLLENYGQQTDIYPPLLVPSDMPTWMTESLKLVDYSGDVIKWNNSAANVNKLIVPTFPDPVVEDCNWLKNRMQEAIQHDQSITSGKRILITRRDSTTRQLINLNEVINLLEDFGFETHTPAYLDVSEQIKLFSQADVIVAAHGAGLTNIVYSTNSTVIELCGSRRSATYYRLSELCGHDYTRMEFPDKYGNITVNIRNLKKKLEEKLR